MAPTALPRLQSATGRWIVLATVLGSAVASLDATVVNVALPAIGRALDSDVAGLQWILSGYTLTLASFILLGGALGDRLGRRRVFIWGTAGFAVTSLICGLANNVETLIAARIAQGVAAALLTPGSLALIAASIDDRDQGAAIGLWSGLGGVAGAVGPLAGGWLIQIASWRAVFLINLPIAAAVVWVSARHVPESRDPDAPARLDLPGAVVVALGLAALTFGLITPAPVAVVAGVVLLGLFVVIEVRSDHPLVPPSLFASRVFTAANLVTLAAYAALGGVFFLLLLQLQIVSGFSPLTAGVATIPITLLMLALSSPAGRWAQKHGPRTPDDHRPTARRRGCCDDDAHRLHRQLPHRRPAGRRRVRPRPVRTGRPTHRRRPRVGAHRRVRHRVGREQRRRPHRAVARGRGTARDRGDRARPASTTLWHSTPGSASR